MTLFELTEKFAELESHVAEEKGPFVFFALFLREGAPNRWDVMVCAPWASPHDRDVTKYFVHQIKSLLGSETLIMLSRIVVLDPDHAAVEEVNREIQVEHGRVEIRDRDFFGQTVKHAYIITSKRPPAPAVA